MISPQEPVAGRPVVGNVVSGAIHLAIGERRIAAGLAQPTRGGRPAAPGAGAGRRRARWAVVVVAGFVAVGAFALTRAIPAARDAMDAKDALERAEEHLSVRDLDAARGDLTSANASLRGMKRQLDGMGPVLPVAKFVPFLRSQVIAVETFQSAGSRLAGAGLRLADAAQQVLQTRTSGSPLSGLLGNLRAIDASLADGTESVRAAAKDVLRLKGRWLFGPIAIARDDLLERLPQYAQQATSTAEGVDALIRFVGGAGPRRYLFFSQNPDEVRPTGGFLGTYGVLTARPGDLSLDQFQPIANFRDRHPETAVPGNIAGSPFKYADPPIPQSIANVNSTADFVSAAKLALQMWNGSGEAHMDGVVSFTPAFLARILGALGPVDVPEYGEHVDQANLVDRFDFYTQHLADHDPAGSDAVRKAFISALAEVVMQKLLAAPASQWQALGEAVGKGFAAREAMAWSADPKVAQALAHRGWDGVLPATSGDFFYNGEFAYANKIGRGVQRDFDHHVELRADGSARVTTVMTVTNTRDRSSALNVGSLSYVTIYGPPGARLDPSSDRPAGAEPPLAGHPAYGWFVNAPPLGRTTLKVVWNVPKLVRKGSHAEAAYSLVWMRVPDHTGDVLRLKVDLPKGWAWADAAPPAIVDLRQDMKGTWMITKGRAA